MHPGCIYKRADVTTRYFKAQGSRGGDLGSGTARAARTAGAREQTAACRVRGGPMWFLHVESVQTENLINRWCPSFLNMP